VPRGETLAWELRALRELLSKTSPVVEETAQRLASLTGLFERAVIVPNEKLADFHEVRTRPGSFVRPKREQWRF
jgi:hypothetical protein